jgi:hypothetical protein
MAMTKLMTDNEIGIDFPDAYIKITHFIGNATDITIGVQVFSNYQARLDNKIPFMTYDYSYSYTDTTCIQDLYTYLKTLPEFADAADV